MSKTVDRMIGPESFITDSTTRVHTMPQSGWKECACGRSTLGSKGKAICWKCLAKEDK